jgi:hypothetical protein
VEDQTKFVGWGNFFALCYKPVRDDNHAVLFLNVLRKEGGGSKGRLTQVDKW